MSATPIEAYRKTLFDLYSDCAEIEKMANRVKQGLEKLTREAEENAGHPASLAFLNRATILVEDVADAAFDAKTHIDS